MLQVTVILQPKNKTALKHATSKAANKNHPRARRALTARQLASLYDPGRARVQVVRDFARKNNLTVVEVSKARHDVVLRGTVSALSRAFGVTLHHFVHDGRHYRAHDEPIVLPKKLAAVALGVLGLDSIPVHKRHAALGHAGAAMTATQLERHYAFPQVDASAQRIALIQFGGGFFAEDVAAFAKEQQLALPRIQIVSVKGSDGVVAKNAPLAAEKTAAVAAAWKDATSFAALFKKFGADLGDFLSTFEVTMDVELSVALGAGAQVDVYFAPPGVDGWRRVIYAALGHSSDGGTNPRRQVPTVMSISWGDNEATFGASSMKVINDALVAAERMGVLVCCASGDRGTSNTYPTANTTGCQSVNVSFPASSPAVIACGGTTLVKQSSTNTFDEHAWKEPFFQSIIASGGGMSGVFPRPNFQSSINKQPVQGTWRAPGNDAKFAGRWLPDIAANAAFSSGVSIHVGGTDLPGGGTSAATPLCAALFARVAALTKHPLAGLTSWLYSLPSVPCRDITVGDNDVCRGSLPFYEAGPGWDACTGWGTPDGSRIVELLTTSLARPAATRA